MAVLRSSSGQKGHTVHGFQLMYGGSGCSKDCNTSISWLVLTSLKSIEIRINIDPYTCAIDREYMSSSCLLISTAEGVT